MGRSIPSYTMLLEEVIREIKEIGRKIGGRDEDRIINRIVSLAREAQGPFYIDSITDTRFLVLLTSLIDLYKRVERLERWISRDGSSD